MTFSASIAEICNFWQLLAVMKPITLHPDLHWSPQFFALSPKYHHHRPKPSILFPAPSFHHYQRNPLTYPDTRPIIYYIQPYSKWVEVHWSLLHLEQYFYFPLFQAQKQRKKNLYKNSCHSCVCNEISRIKHWTTIDECQSGAALFPQKIKQNKTNATHWRKGGTPCTI